MKRADYILCAAALLGAFLFFSSVSFLWPLGHETIQKNSAELESDILHVLQEQDISIADYQNKSRLRVDDQALHFIEHSVGQNQAKAYVEKGLPLLYYRLTYKQPDNPVTLTCAIHPNGSILGWNEDWPRDKSADPIEKQQALVLATTCIIKQFKLRSLELIEEHKRSYEQRSEFEFVFKYVHQTEPDIIEHINVIVSGQHIRKAWRSMQIPAASERAIQRNKAPSNFLATIGFALFSIGATFAVIKLLLTLNSGKKLAIVPCLWICAALSVMLLINSLLQNARLFEAWDPIWPSFVAYAQFLLNDVLFNIVPLVPLFGFLVMAQHINQENKSGRLDSFWLCMRGRFTEPSVQRSSLQGFAVGFLCGSALVISVLGIQSLFNGNINLQPRGFFFYTINSSASIITCLCFFGYIALLEEGAYRLFGGSYLHQRFKSKWIAIIIPGIIYGLCHAEFAFLPPADPWWARAFCLSIVGCVWGWAFFRYDALTVILSHFAADLFIFNWPLIASGETWPQAMAVISISIPLWPAVIGKLYAPIKNKQESST